MGALCMLVDVREKSGCTSYAQAVDCYYGKSLGTFLSAILAIGSFGSACASMMFATTFLMDVLEMGMTIHMLEGMGVHTSADAIDANSFVKPACAISLGLVL